MPMNRLVIIESYDDLPNAHIALGRLRQEGIPASLRDEHFVQTDWAYSIAAGGIKLQVPAEYEARARQVLATDYSGEIREEDIGTGPESGGC